MKKLLALSLLLVSATAFANGPWLVFQQMIRLPKNSTSGQLVAQHYDWATPALGSTQTLVSAAALGNAVATTISTFAVQPDYARNLVISFGGSTTHVAAGNVVVTGTNIYGKTVTETTAITDSTTKTGATAFKTVTSVLIPATSGPSATVTVVAGDKLGIDRCSGDAGDYDFSKFGGVYETTRGTFANDASHVELNTFTPHGTMDGATAVKLIYIQNFACYN